MVMENRVSKCAESIFEVSFEVQIVFNSKLFRVVFIFATRGQVGGGLLGLPHECGVRLI